MASAPMSMADLVPNRPNGCRPTPMIATSSMSDLPTVGDRRERERHDLGAVLLRPERHDHQLHRPSRSAASPGRSPSDAPRPAPRHPTAPGRRRTAGRSRSSRRSAYGSFGQEALRRERPQRPPPRQPVPLDLCRTTPRTRRRLGERHRPTRPAPPTEQLRRIRRPREHVSRERHPGHNAHLHLTSFRRPPSSVGDRGPRTSPATLLPLMTADAPADVSGRGPGRVPWAQTPLGRVASLGQDGRHGPSSPRAGSTPRPSHLEGAPRCRVADVPRRDRPALASGARSFGILSTYPPTPCGLATFSAALADGLSRTAAPSPRRARSSDGSPTPRRSWSSASWSTVRRRRSSAAAGASEPVRRRHRAARVRRSTGAADGDEVLEVLGALEVPSIVVAHTVLAQPTPHQRSVLERSPPSPTQVVVMTEAARDRLCRGFDVDPTKVTTIPHGAAIAARQLSRPLGADRRPCSPGASSGRARASSGSSTPCDRSRICRPGRATSWPARPTPRSWRPTARPTANARIEQAWRNGVASSVDFDADYRDVALADRADPVQRPWWSCPTTPRTR